MQKALIALTALVLLSACAYAVQVDGYCYLAGQTNHEGTKVLFQADSPGAVTDSTYTNGVGYYQIDLSAGAYDIYFTHQGYFGEQILDQLLLSPTTMQEITLVLIGIEISGELSGLLEDTTYRVIGDIWVSSGDSLTIEVGAELIFGDEVQFDINGYLYAAGTEIDSIKFINSSDSTWGGIDFNSSSDDSSRLEYCLITGSSSIGIYFDHSNPTFENCTISGNSAGNRGGGIYCLMDSSPAISNCTISGNSASNHGGGIYCWDSSLTISNCTISGNSCSWGGGGIYCYYSSPTIINTIVEGNTGNRSVYLSNSPNTYIAYSDFYNNQNGNFYNPPQWVGQIVTLNANGDSCDLYYNIFEDPLFYSTTGDSAFFLTVSSPCIDAGDPASPRDPDSTIADMGAFWPPMPPVWVEPSSPSPQTTAYSLSPAYPNPFNAGTIISYELQAASWVKLVVYDVRGREVARLIDDWRTAGNYDATFDAGGLPSGIYFARLQANGLTQTQKILLLK
ncbi:MAG: right-handed parallel beta-helix repeat-containing protein [candidate division Zixibacteria bacterium]|nr:right-handed parallel beta-helix repeat-containing protein [Candidatus Tariuqbacter arcticus]